MIADTNDPYTIDTTTRHPLLWYDHVYVALHPFPEPDNHACLLVDGNEVVPHDDAIRLVERILDGYAELDKNDLYGGSLAEALRNQRVRDRVEQYHNWSLQKNITNACVYIMESQGVYKIGLSDNPRRRCKDIEQREGHPVTIIHSRRVTNPGILERRLHTRFNEQRLHGEWFAFGGFDLDKAISLIDSWEGEE